MVVDVSFEATLEAPLAVRKSRGSRFADVTDHLPGSTLRGALATAWLREMGKEHFEALFLEGCNQFPFLYPGGVESRPYPLTAMSCKRHEGPKNDGHGVEDTLLARAGYHPRYTMADALQCKECKEDRKPIRGYRESIAVRHQPPSRTYRMGVGIEAHTGSAAHKILFGVVALEPTHSSMHTTSPEDQRLRQLQRSSQRGTNAPNTDHKPVVLGGVGRLQEEHFSLLQQLCHEEEGFAAPLFAGAARSRGFGRFRLRLSRYQRPSLKERFGSYQRYAPDGRRLFAVTLDSPTILVDDYLRNATDLMLALPSGLELQPQESWQHAQTQIVSGWNALTKMAKADELALQAGSVLLATSTLPPKELLKKLNGVEVEGLGIRRDEGFGRITICDPFHVTQDSAS